MFSFKSIFIILWSIALVWVGIDAIINKTIHFKLGAIITGLPAIIIGAVCIILGIFILCLDLYLSSIAQSLKKDMDE